MFLKNLKIYKNLELLRDIPFGMGINLIVDETVHMSGGTTGNSVGKTTTLKLIDFCLGAEQSIIYTDQENKKEVYDLVKNYLIENKVLIELTLKKDLSDNSSEEVVIERNFLSGKKRIQNINGASFTQDEFEHQLMRILISDQEIEKPSFRQIISHNIRYSDDSINATLKTLSPYTSDAEYESLYLFLFGCSFTGGSQKQALLEKLHHEQEYKKRIEKKQTRSAYEATLSLVNSEIEDLNSQKEFTNSKDDFESNLSLLNEIKCSANRLAFEINSLSIRKSIIEDAAKDFELRKSNIDIAQLRQIYSQVTDRLGDIQKSFEDLVHFHDRMLDEKINYIKNELPSLNKLWSQKNEELKVLLSREREYSGKVAQSSSYIDLEDIIGRLSDSHRRKGECEAILKELDEAESNIKNYQNGIDKINEDIFSDNFQEKVKKQLDKFNKHFSQISDSLYGEKYAVSGDISKTKTGQRIFKFKAFNLNFSSGKKQGEISCFDMAYIKFAREENIPCLEFLLYDKKELMHDNQLVKIAEYVSLNNIQFVASVLRSKIPVEINKEENIILKLSQAKKLFMIEENNS